MIDFEESLPSDIPIVVLDTETTGLFPGLGHRIVEIGAIRMENWRVTGEINQLIQPDRKMDPRSTAVNHITDEDLVGKPTFIEISNDLAALMDGALLVAHNAAFDAEFLGMEYVIGNYAVNGAGSGPPLANPWLCTLLLARRHFYFGRNNLGHIAHKLGVRMGLAHRALNDVYMTAEVLKRMVRELGNQRLKTVGDLLHAQGGAIFIPPPAAIDLPDLVNDALRKRQPLRILYFGDTENSERTITPKYPCQHRGVSYLVAHCHDLDEQHLFRIDRIFSAEILPFT